MYILHFKLDATLDAPAMPRSVETLRYVHRQQWPHLLVQNYLILSPLPVDGCVWTLVDRDPRVQCRRLTVEPGLAVAYDVFAALPVAG